MAEAENSNPIEMQALVKKRETLQLSEWECEQKKRELLGQKPFQPNTYRRNIMAVIMVLAAIVGLIKAFPNEAGIAAVVVVAYVTYERQSVFEKFLKLKVVPKRWSKVGLRREMKKITHLRIVNL